MEETEYQPWQEATERDVPLEDFVISEIAGKAVRREVSFGTQKTIESLRGRDGKLKGVLIRRQRAIDAAIEISAENAGEGVWRMTVRIVNRTEMGGTEEMEREQALMRSLISTHTILGVSGGEFISLADPPAELKDVAAACQNVGAWPVLVGVAPARDTVLSSPIILSDYPELAPESPGDLFDSTEIDEILTLRIMTLTDDEKRTAAGTDARVKDLMAQTEALAREQLSNLHGTMRGLRRAESEESHA